MVKVQGKVKIVVRHGDYYLKIMKGITIKNVDLCKSAQINKVYCIVTIVLISFFIKACAAKKVSNDTAITEIEIEHYQDSQQQWLTSLKEGMSLEDALSKVFPYQIYFFQRKEKGHLFQYSEGVYPKTGMLFGLLFEDHKVTSLLLDQAVFDLFKCRLDIPEYQLVDTWHTKDFEKTILWIREQNRLGDEYDDVSKEYIIPDDSAGSGKVTEAIITGVFFAPFVPVALMAQPFVPENKSDYYIQRQHLHELYNRIELGVTTGADLIKLLGEPNYKDEKTGNWRWDGYGFIKIGFVEGTVYWTESKEYHWFSPHNNKTINKANYKCVPSNEK